MELTRRDFLANTAVTAAGAAALGAIATRPAMAEESASADGDTDTTEHNPIDTATADIVVVGSGTAGMCCATRAAQLGANVVLLEKRGALGGSSGFAEGVGGINTYLQKQEGMDEIDVNEVFTRAQDYHHWAADSNVLLNFIQNSGATIDWLHDDCNIDFAQTTVVSATSYSSWHLGNDADGNIARLADSLIAPLQSLCEDLGVEIHTESPATGLVTDGDTVTGVYYTDDAGEHEVDATTVVLATGGYSNNQEMFEDFVHVPFDRIHNWGVEGRDGDGIRWAHDLGAAYHIPSTVMGACTSIPDTVAFEEPANWIFSWQPNLRVNQDGKRFFNEELAADFSVSNNAILAQTQSYSIMDQGYVDMIANDSLPFGMASVGYEAGKPMDGAADAVAQAVTDGRVYQADTIAELAEQMGVDADALQATIDEYNECADNGSDPVYGTSADALRAIKDAPFYAAPIQPGMFTTVGGLAVDTQFRVLRDDGSTIGGLYALGGDASSDTGRDYDVGVFAGSQQGWCATGGRLVAEELFGE